MNRVLTKHGQIMHNQRPAMSRQEVHVTWLLQLRLLGITKNTGWSLLEQVSATRSQSIRGVYSAIWPAAAGYLSLTWGLLEKPHDVPNLCNRNPQPSAWAISTLSKLGNFSKAMWKDRCTKLHDPNNTSSPTADSDAERDCSLLC
jgi:hypothetical protein